MPFIYHIAELTEFTNQQVINTTTTIETIKIS